MSKPTEVQEGQEAHLALWSARLESLTQMASPMMKARFHKELEEWKIAGIAAVAKLTELRAANGDSWDVIKRDLDKIWQAIEAGLAEAQAKTAPPTNVKRTA